MKWGQDNEGRARELYIAQQAAGGLTVSVRHTGLTLSPEMPFLGASSDGVVTVQDGNCSSTGCLEIKCAFSIEGESVVHLTPKEIAEKYGTKFYMHATGKDGQLCLDPEHNYYVQVQGEMAIMGYEWCDFVAIVFSQRFSRHPFVCAVLPFRTACFMDGNKKILDGHLPVIPRPRFLHHGFRQPLALCMRKKSSKSLSHPELEPFQKFTIPLENLHFHWKYVSL